ncbi:RAD protein [Plasmodium gonderi]|uniref:RAD protein n=1 Tax=Plasmodium gonderi TaxID=77519 RepID=A0A1Y1JH65_PLAGO|nr:RAD protein [Plasmodium gonderi]GAW79783.1 RAD protein [Plasmodium gonderi]
MLTKGNLKAFSKFSRHTIYILLFLILAILPWRPIIVKKWRTSKGRTLASNLEPKEEYRRVQSGNFNSPSFANTLLETFLNEWESNAERSSAERSNAERSSAECCNAECFNAECCNAERSNTNGGKTPLEIYEPDTIREVSREELNKRIAYCGMLVINKKRAHAAIYAYINYLKGKYYKMLANLKNNFLNLASTHGLPEELQNIYWTQCENELIRDLKVAENISQKHFKLLMDNKVIFTLHFNWTLAAHEASWFADMFEKELKWNRILQDRINNYVLG